MLRKRLAVIATVVCLLASGCSSTGSADEEDGAAGGSAATAPDVIGALAEVGIGVYDDPGATQPVLGVAEPVSPVRLLRRQAESLGSQLEGGVGLTAAELDALIPAESAGELTAAASGAIDGWAAQAGTPASRLASELMAPAEEGTVPVDDHPRFSELVMLLFASDLAAAGESLAADPAATSEASPAAYVAARAPAAASVGAACQKAVAFAADVQAAVHNALDG